jgi:hypothetical protein
MNATLTTFRLFETWLAQTWRQTSERAALRRAAEAERRHQEAVIALRERAARYEREQPGYAADLRDALARTEREIPFGPRTTHSR